LESGIFEIREIDRGKSAFRKTHSAWGAFEPPMPVWIRSPWQSGHAIRLGILGPVFKPCHLRATFDFGLMLKKPTIMPNLSVP